MAEIFHTVQDGETLADIASAASVTVDFLLANNSVSTLELNGGQQLVVGFTEPEPEPEPDPYAGGLPTVNSSNPDAQPLQAELKRVGYWPDSVGTGSLYGPRTQNGVRIFYQAQPGNQFDGVTNFVSDQIGPQGWAHLREEPTGSFQISANEPAHNYSRVTYNGGKTVNARTRDMLNHAATLTPYSWSPYVTQGSYNSGVSASAGTHDGGGVVDIRTSTMTLNGMRLAVHALREAGFAAWLRTPAEGFAYHIHAVAIGDREMSQSAHDQVLDYFAGRNGLANNGPDTHPDGRPYPTWAGVYKPNFDAAPGGGGDGGTTPGTIPYSQIQYNQKGQHPYGESACASYARQALDILGYPHTYWVPGLVTIAGRETAYNHPNWQINTSDSNAKNVPELNGGGPAPDGYPGQCSRGCMQTIPQTFGTYHLAGTSLDIYNPVASMGAAIRYIRAVYGVSTGGSDLASKVQQADPNRPPRGY